jgi:hypothetical protein
LGIAFAAFAASRCWAGDLDLPETAVAAPANPASTLDEPIRQIADTPAGCAVLDKDFPGLRQHAMYDFFKSMTLKQIAALSKGQITQEMLAQAQTDLLALKAASGPTVGASMAAVPVSTAAVATTEP